MKLGDIVKDYRTKHNLTMQEFANKAKLSKGYVSMLEKGVNPQTKKPIIPLLNTVNQIAEAMNVDLEVLLKILDKNQPISLIDNNQKNKHIEYPDLFLPTDSTLAHRFVKEKRPLGADDIYFDTMTDEQAIAYANLISQADKRADEDARLYIFKSKK